MENAVIERIKKVLEENRTSITAFSKIAGLVQTTVNRQLRGDTQLTLETIEAFLHQYPTVSAEWILRGVGDSELRSMDGDLEELKKRVIKLEAENNLLREIQGLGERKDVNKIAG